MAISLEKIDALINETKVATAAPSSAPAAQTGRGDSEIKELLASVPLIDIVRRGTGEQGRETGGRVYFHNCPICGHRDCFSVYLETNSWSCYSSSNTTGYTGGSLLEYLMARYGYSISEAVAELRRLADRPRKPRRAAPAPVASLPPISREIKEMPVGGDAEPLKYPPIKCPPMIDPPARAPVLIDGILREGHKILITAASKAGKTWLLIELAIAVATGTEWLGRDCKKGRVLYADMELDPPSFVNRLAAVADGMGVGREEAQAGLDTWSLRGYEVSMRRFTEELLSRARKGEYKLLIIDPLYKVYEGNENSADDAREFWKQIDLICRSLGCAVACSHHHSKGAKGDASPIDRGSGSGVFGRDPDAVLDVIEVFPCNGEETGFDEGVRVFRIADSGLREFSGIEPFEVAFEYKDKPRHIVLEDGEASTWKPRSLQQMAGRASGEHRREEKEKAAKQNEELLISALDGRESIPLSEAAKLCDCTTQTLKRRLEGSDRLEAVNPSQYRCEVRRKRSE